MNVASSEESSESNIRSAKEPTVSPFTEPQNRSIRTTLTHQGYTLIGLAFVVFECIFLILYSNEFWFNTNVFGLGIPVVVCAIFIAHLLLCWFESDNGCYFFAPIWKRRPPMVYRRWLRLNDDGLEPGLTFGQRHVRWQAIDEVELTIWGNLRILSSALSGSPSSKRSQSKLPFFRAEGLEEILKFPFGIANLADQKLLIETMRHHNPALKTNERLTKRLDTKEVKGAIYVQQIGVGFLLLVLLDVGFSMFSYLEMLKNYYVCEVAGTAANRNERKLAPIFFQQAESIRENPLPVSWVSTKIMREGKVASGLFQTRAEALWAIGRKDDAIESMKKSLSLSPGNFRLNLRLARLMALNGQHDQAIEQLSKALDNHESALLPRLYTLALSPSEERSRVYKSYLHDLDDELFGTDLMWPPGSHVFLQDVFYRDDLTFIFDRMLNTDTSGIHGTELKPTKKKAH